MSKILSSIRWPVALMVIAVALPATADAPPLQYDRFDGATAAIHDTFTGLTWGRRAVGGLNHAGAQLNCQSLFPGAGRLPTAKELLTLVDEQPHDHYEEGHIVRRSIDQAAFPDPVTPIDRPYWTSTVLAGGKITGIDFITGMTLELEPGASANTRCVK